MSSFKILDILHDDVMSISIESSAVRSTKIDIRRCALSRYVV